LRPWLALKLARVLRGRGVDLVYTHNSAAGFYGALAGRLSRRPVLHTKHGAHTAGTRAQKALDRLSFTMTDHVVAVGGLGLARPWVSPTVPSWWEPSPDSPR
jgi:hypothetical protein